MKTITLLTFLLLLPGKVLTEGHIRMPLSDERPNILFLIADDWSYPHAGILGDSLAQTPAFDYLASGGAVFSNAYCAAPSCSPSRASILTGKYPHQLGEAGNLWSVLSIEHPNWMSLLHDSGYHTGKAGKGWGPGNHVKGGYEHNPAGKDYTSFEDFIEARDPLQPFAFWFGSTDPHRPYQANTGVEAGMDPAAVSVPAFLPDLPCVRNDLLDYYYEIERFDRDCGAILRQLTANGLMDNTLIVMTSDNGMPFPRAKANLYDYGTRMPLAIYWKGKVAAGSKIGDFINFVDFAPTFLRAAGLEVPAEMAGKSFIGLLTGGEAPEPAGEVFLERERHANVRRGDLSYPMRGVRTRDYLYIRNFETDRWPAGDPKTYQSVGQYGDVDNSITKFLMMRDSLSPHFELAFKKRPAEELYVLATDPYNLTNVAGDEKYGQVLAKLRNEVSEWMQETGDMRYREPQTKFWDEAWYTPDYQFFDFNLGEEISAYRMARRDPGGAAEEIPCSP